jgi:hypothetical protein
MALGKDSGVAVVPFVLSAFLGLVVAFTGSYALVAAGTAKPSEPVTKPLITYDSP